MLLIRGGLIHTAVDPQPFTGDILVEDGKIYGRGTNDDKGPSLAALFAMRAIRC